MRKLIIALLIVGAISFPVVQSVSAESSGSNFDVAAHDPDPGGGGR